MTPHATLILCAALTSLLPGHGDSLLTEYRDDRAFRVTVETDLSLETVDFTVTIDGQEPEGGRGDRMRERETSVSRRSVHVDRMVVDEDEDDDAFVVHRTFEEIEGSANDSDRESELEGVTLEVRRADDSEEAEVSVHEGDEPSDTRLEGHQPELDIDALLPEDDSVAVGDSWEFEAEDIARFLGQNVQLFQRAEPQGGGERGGGRRGGGRRGGGARDHLRGLDWEGRAELMEENVDRDGIDCVRIQITLTAEGEREEPTREGRGRGGFLAGTPAVAPLPATTYEVELEGELFFSRSEKRPVACELEGSLLIEREIERDMRGSAFYMHSVQEGTFEYSLQIETL